MNATVSFAYRIADMQAATMLTLRKQWIWRGSLRFLAIIMAIIVAMNMAMSFDYLSAEPLAALMTFIGLGFLFALVGLIFLAIWLSIAMPRAARTQFDQLSLQGQSVEIGYDDELLRLRDQGNDMSVPWTSILRWTENAKVLLLYRSDQCVHYLPKELVDPQHFEAIRRNLGNANVPHF